MSCPICNGPTVWRGSLARGRNVCAACDPAEEELVWAPGAGRVSATLARYYTEVQAWHRDWCQARKAAKSAPGKRTDPKLCDCGFTQTTPYSQTEIEQRETATYGRVAI